MGIWTADLGVLARENANFLAVKYTGEHSELTVMCLRTGDDVGTTVGRRVDQVIRVESGLARLSLGRNAKIVDETHDLAAGSAAFIPAGVWHNITNIGTDDLRLSCLYSPPVHAEGLVLETKASWEAEKRDIAKAAAETGAFGA